MEHCTAYTVHCIAGVANLSRAENGPLQKKMMALLTFMRVKKSHKKICNEKDLNIFDFLAHLP